jgi:hypothetical protein
MRKSCPQIGQRIFEESFAGWQTCIVACFLGFVFADVDIETRAIRTSALGGMFRVLGDHNDFRDVARRTRRACEKSLSGELRRPRPTRQPEQIDRMCCGGHVPALFPRMVISKLAQNHGSHGCAFGRRVLLPIETETLTADVAANVLAELRSSEQQLHLRRPNRACHQSASPVPRQLKNTCSVARCEIPSHSTDV